MIGWGIQLLQSNALQSVGVVVSVDFRFHRKVTIHRAGRLRPPCQRGPIHGMTRHIALRSTKRVSSRRYRLFDFHRNLPVAVVPSVIRAHRLSAIARRTIHVLKLAINSRPACVMLRGGGTTHVGPRLREDENASEVTRALRPESPTAPEHQGIRPIVPSILPSRTRTKVEEMRHPCHYDSGQHAGEASMTSRAHWSRAINQPINFFVALPYLDMLPKCLLPKLLRQPCPSATGFEARSIHLADCGFVYPESDESDFSHPTVSDDLYSITSAAEP